jgi:AcrR family transcriptional regulator
MGGKLLENKRKKMAKLYDAAYDLFTSNGVHNTVVDDIVKNAGVAKGTFYLYCKDKYDLVDKVIIRKTSALINGALEQLKERKKTQPASFQQNVIFFADYLIQFFRSDPKFLELIFKNLSLELYTKAMSSEEMAAAREAFVENFVRGGGNSEEASKRLFLIVSLVGSVCYNSIVLKGPYSFDEIKPELYHTVELILS